MNKKTLVTTAIVTAISTALLKGGIALAQGKSASDNPMSSLVQKIADRFGLNEAEVQTVFDENRAEHQAKMEAEREKKQAEIISRLEERLDEAVSNGEITEEQKALILAKQEELTSNRQAQMESTKDLTNEERRQIMETAREALQTWAQENNIDIKYLMLGPGPDGPRHRGGPGGPGPDTSPPTNDQSPAPADTSSE